VNSELLTLNCELLTETGNCELPNC